MPGPSVRFKVCGYSEILLCIMRPTWWRLASLIITTTPSTEINGWSASSWNMDDSVTTFTA